MPLPFSKAQDIKLISLVKDNPILYNPRTPSYLDTDAREVTWHKIGDVLGRPARMCKTRWANIRDMMRRRVRERASNQTQRTYHYKYWDELIFMLPFFRDAPAQEFDFLEEAAEQAEVYLEEETYEEDVKVNIKKKDDSFVDNNINVSNVNVGQELNPADPLDTFLLTIGSTLRKFNPYYLNQAKSKIFQVVQEYELEQIVEKHGPEGHSSGDR